MKNSQSCNHKAIYRNGGEGTGNLNAADAGKVSVVVGGSLYATTFHHVIFD